MNPFFFEERLAINRMESAIVATALFRVCFREFWRRHGEFVKTVVLAGLVIGLMVAGIFLGIKRMDAEVDAKSGNFGLTAVEQRLAELEPSP